MRERKKELVGRVVSDRMDKTVVVAVNSIRMHRLYKRMMRSTKKYMAHDDTNDVRVGDLVRIQESRPISRNKHWRIANVLEEAAKRGKAVVMPVVSATAGVPAETAIANTDVSSGDQAGADGPSGADRAEGEQR